MSGTRIGLMMKRFARQVPLGGRIAALADPRSRFARGSVNHPEGEFPIFG
jgi:hypothetical protein